MLIQREQRGGYRMTGGRRRRERGLKKKKTVDGRQDREEGDDNQSEKSLWGGIYNPEKWEGEREEGNNCHIR
jgi:hypothetical protein